MSIERTKEDRERFERDMARLRVKHTPGPWRVKDNMLTEDGSVMTRVGHVVCQYCKRKVREEPLPIQVLAKGWGVAHLLTVDPQQEHEQHLANAQLIARAPAMAELLERVSEFLDGQSDVVDGDQGEPTPNRAMSLKREVDVLLGRETDGY